LAVSELSAKVPVEELKARASSMRLCSSTPTFAQRAADAVQSENLNDTSEIFKPDFGAQLQQKATPH
jgi:hypothetical protein